LRGLRERSEQGSREFWTGSFQHAPIGSSWRSSLTNLNEAEAKQKKMSTPEQTIVAETPISIEQTVAEELQTVVADKKDLKKTNKKIKLAESEEAKVEEDEVIVEGKAEEEAVVGGGAEDSVIDMEEEVTKEEIAKEEPAKEEEVTKEEPAEEEEIAKEPAKEEAEAAKE
jgi:hypothetical protein